VVEHRKAGKELAGYNQKHHTKQRAPKVCIMVDIGATLFTQIIGYYYIQNPENKSGDKERQKDQPDSLQRIEQDICKDYSGYSSGCTQAAILMVCTLFVIVRYYTGD